MAVLTTDVITAARRGGSPRVRGRLLDGHRRHALGFRRLERSLYWPLAPHHGRRRGELLDAQGVLQGLVPGHPGLRAPPQRRDLGRHHAVLPGLHRAGDGVGVQPLLPLHRLQLGSRPPPVEEAGRAAPVQGSYRPADLVRHRLHRDQWHDPGRGGHELCQRRRGLRRPRGLLRRPLRHKLCAAGRRLLF
ncbi:MAG: hypothetical protein BJ554DRAFT_7404 [Olpidium bornovanus]|uniref:Uncharacterized protein n=1 Tax=Olpidium bornovanus TaxID=278681 RepID=A0A8H8DJG1_9FUNG|nr:MAG: hypothetical protein BJ554DRAFT_7404 [Olpidium bornovanus]